MEPDLSQAQESVTGTFLVSSPYPALQKQDNVAYKSGTDGTNSAPAHSNYTGQLYTAPSSCLRGIPAQKEVPTH